MTTESAADEEQAAALWRGHPGSGEDGRDLAAAPSIIPVDPTAGMVLHRALAMSARTFLSNELADVSNDLADVSNDLADEIGVRTGGPERADPWSRRPGARPLWAHGVGDPPAGRRSPTEAERIHQSRVAMRRIRSNLKTFRLLLDPAWGTALRGELAWYGDRLGAVRDLHIMSEIITTKGPGVMEAHQVAALGSVVAARRVAVMAEVAGERLGPRRSRITEQMMVLWEGVELDPRAARPAAEVLPPMLGRAWHDLRGAARAARKKPTEAHLHKLRIRLKDIRYGCETVALVEGGTARKTAKAAEHLQTKLGDLHDACFSIGWLRELAADRPDLAGAIGALVPVQADEAAAVRKGWKRDLSAVERHWRRWRR